MVWCGAVWYGAAQYGMVRHSMVWCFTVRCGAAQLGVNRTEQQGNVAVRWHVRRFDSAGAWGSDGAARWWNGTVQCSAAHQWLWHSIRAVAATAVGRHGAMWCGGAGSVNVAWRGAACAWQWGGTVRRRGAVWRGAAQRRSGTSVGRHGAVVRRRQRGAAQHGGGAITIGYWVLGAIYNSRDTWCHID